MTHPFDVAMALDSMDGLMRGQTTPDFANMVGPFGGVTAAAIVRAIENHPDRLGDPVSLTVNYAAPIADGDFVVDLRAARTNRTNQHWIAELSQSTDVKTTATAVFGLRRPTWSDTEPRPPAVPAPEDCASQDNSSFVTWMRNYEMRFVEGAMPGADTGENPDSTTTVWVRPQPHRALDYAALTALCDVFYPRVFLRRGQFIPAGTISFTAYFHADADDLARQGDDYVLATARAQRFSGGFFDQSAQVWGRDGTLLAVTHQIVYFKG
ncbi:acyl-CoA thioesterase [Mycolicibacterium mengxianglii]|uniref:acyl-CoA thioesterase n=1 Tax=Mycolicibacterium mengxianglii TaxID=2736649 RepID=UPI0018EEE95B|nr:thioesterase family protein [Mycolicibacterium mengxianglii]